MSEGQIPDEATYYKTPSVKYSASADLGIRVLTLNQ